jgi:hypothetical protein
MILLEHEVRRRACVLHSSHESRTDPKNPMSARPSRWLLAIAIACVAGASTAAAAEIFRWVDADGTVHFSDTKPPEDVETTMRTVTESYTSAYDPAGDPYSILNQAKRTHERWLDLEDARQARAARRTAARAEPDSRSALRIDARDSRAWPVGYVVPAPVPPRYPAGAAPSQVRALESLDLGGTRPYSINSGAHRERVERSQALPLVPPPSKPRPSPHRAMR